MLEKKIFTTELIGIEQENKSNIYLHHFEVSS